jgi:hypothetical protein
MKKKELYTHIKTAKAIFVVVNTNEDVGRSVKVSKKTATNLTDTHFEHEEIKAKYYAAHRILYIG